MSVRLEETANSTESLRAAAATTPMLVVLDRGLRTSRGLRTNRRVGEAASARRCAVTAARSAPSW